MTQTKRISLGNRKDVDMTQGNIIRHLITFAIPLLIGNVFQQLYNLVDTLVLGNYVGSEAYDAVGAVGPIINLLIGLFLGFSSGAGVVISQYYGAKQYDKVHDAVHTAILMTFVMAVVFSIAGVLLVPLMLRLMGMPDYAFEHARTYLTIYFAGMIGLMVYNIGSGILRAIGDSKRPFYFLIVSAVTNTLLDLVFVLVFNMGVEGVALATIIAQGLSATLIVITLLRTKTCVKLNIKDIRFDKDAMVVHKQMLSKVVRIGLPAALQMAITSFSNIFVQKYINDLGNGCMGGWTTYSKVDQLILLPMQSLSIAATTFVGQNLGINDVKRARKGANTALAIAVAMTAILIVPVVVFAPEIAPLFSDEPATVDKAVLFLQILSPFYVLCCVNQIYSGVLRGAGNSKIPMIIMLSSFVAFRQIYLAIMSSIFPGNEIAVAMGYPAGWLLASVLIFIYYKKAKLSKSRIVEDYKNHSEPKKA